MFFSQCQRRGVGIPAGLDPSCSHLGQGIGIWAGNPPRKELEGSRLEWGGAGMFAKEFLGREWDLDRGWDRDLCPSSSALGGEIGIWVGRVGSGQGIPPGRGWRDPDPAGMGGLRCSPWICIPLAAPGQGDPGSGQGIPPGRRWRDPDPAWNWGGPRCSPWIWIPAAPGQGTRDATANPGGKGREGAGPAVIPGIRVPPVPPFGHGTRDARSGMLPVDLHPSPERGIWDPGSESRRGGAGSRLELGAPGGAAPPAAPAEGWEWGREFRVGVKRSSRFGAGVRAAPPDSLARIFPPSLLLFLPPSQS